MLSLELTKYVVCSFEVIFQHFSQQYLDTIRIELLYICSYSVLLDFRHYAIGAVVVNFIYIVSSLIN